MPAERIYGTEFRYNDPDEMERIVRTTAGYGKVAVLDELQAALQIGPAHIICVGDGSRTPTMVGKRI